MRCTGHCCKKFFIPITPGDILLEQENLAAGRPPKWEDGHIIADMVIHVENMEEGGGWYTCKHFDSKTGNCQNYDGRPRMCSLYPYGDVCNYKGCTMKDRGLCSK